MSNTDEIKNIYEFYKDDWRIFDQPDYLYKAVCEKRKYTKYSETWDHEHCVFCWAKISEYEGDIHECYHAIDADVWICEACFDDFKDMFQWTVAKSDI